MGIAQRVSMALMISTPIVDTGLLNLHLGRYLPAMANIALALLARARGVRIR